MTEEQNQNNTELVRIEDMNLEEAQISEQLYQSAGLDPVVDAGLKDYDKRIQQEDRLLSKVLGPRAGDIRGYGEAVAKRVALAVYSLLNKQYGGRVGDLRSYIMTLEEERNRATANYDELMGRVVGMLGEEYKQLRTDSAAFMERLTGVLGEDLAASKIDHEALASKLADIDSLRSQVRALEAEREQLKETHQSRVQTLGDAHREEVEALRSQIAELESRVQALESDNAELSGEVARVSEDSRRLGAVAAALEEEVPADGIGKDMANELHAMLLQDASVPRMVIDGVGKFIDFRKYLGLAATRGAEEATRQAKETLRRVLEA